MDSITHYDEPKRLLNKEHLKEELIKCAVNYMMADKYPNFIGYIYDAEEIKYKVTQFWKDRNERFGNVRFQIHASQDGKLPIWINSEDFFFKFPVTEGKLKTPFVEPRCEVRNGFLKWTEYIVREYKDGYGIIPLKHWGLGEIN